MWAAGIVTFAVLYAPQGLLTQLAAEYALTPAEASWAVSATTLGLACAILPWAFFSDRVGRHRALQIATLATGILAIASPFAPGFGLFLAGRALLGAALGGIPALAVSYIQEAAPAGRAPSLAASYVAATSAGGLLGRIAIAPLAELAGWRLALVGLGVAAAAICALLAATLPATPVRRVTLRQSLTLFFRQLGSGAVWPYYAVGALSIGVLVAVYNSLVFRLEAPPYLLAPTAASLVFLCYLAGAVSSRLSSGISARIGARATIAVAGCAVLAGALVTLASPLWLVIAGVALLTAGEFLGHATANAQVPRVAREGRQHAVALYSVTYYIGASAFGVLGAQLFGSAGWPGLVAGAAVAALAIAGFGILAREPRG